LMTMVAYRRLVVHYPTLPDSLRQIWPDVLHALSVRGRQDLCFRCRAFLPSHRYVGRNLAVAQMAHRLPTSDFGALNRRQGRFGDTMNTSMSSWRAFTTPTLTSVKTASPRRSSLLTSAAPFARQGADEYRDPVLFLRGTHLTRTLRSLIAMSEDVAWEPGANSVIHLQTNFGGGKTHAELRYTTC